MIGLDTNVLVRYFAQDDAKQAKAASELIENQLGAEATGFISTVVLAELVWVLVRAYAASREEITDIVGGLLASPVLTVEHKGQVWHALREFRTTTGDFSDYLIARVNAEAGCSATVTFDRRAAKIAGFELLR